MYNFRYSAWDEVAGKNHTIIVHWCTMLIVYQTWSTVAVSSNASIVHIVWNGRLVRVGKEDVAWLAGEEKALEERGSSMPDLAKVKFIPDGREPNS